MATTLTLPSAGLTPASTPPAANMPGPAATADTADASRTIPSAAPAELSEGKKIFAFAVMCVGFFIALLDIQIVAASLKDIGGGLSAGADELSWVQTSYLIAEIIVIPLSVGFPRDVNTLAVLRVRSGLHAHQPAMRLAWNIQSMIVFRVLQGFLGGSMIPTAFTAAFAFFKGQRVVIAAACIGALSSLAPTLGPTVGGWITDNYSWHWLFFINLVPEFLLPSWCPSWCGSTNPTWGCYAAPTTWAWC